MNNKEYYLKIKTYKNSFKEFLFIRDIWKTKIINIILKIKYYTILFKKIFKYI
jgi:hypothetical protein